MSLPIDCRITHAAYEFEIKTGIKPTVVYLGGRESTLLHYWFENLPGPKVPMQVAGYGPRTQFRGMKVYRVDERDYLAVG